MHTYCLHPGRPFSLFWPWCHWCTISFWLSRDLGSDSIDIWVCATPHTTYWLGLRFYLADPTELFEYVNIGEVEGPSRRKGFGWYHTFSLRLKWLKQMVAYFYFIYHCLNCVLDIENTHTYILWDKGSSNQGEMSGKDDGDENVGMDNVGSGQLRVG